MSERVARILGNHLVPAATSFLLNRIFWSKNQQNCVVTGAHLVAINTEAEQVRYFALNFFLVVEENTEFTI